CVLSIRQQPKEALVTTNGKEKARKTLDPPPIVQLVISPQDDPQKQFLANPYFFVVVSLLKADTNEPYNESGEKTLMGSLVSSLHRLKEVNNDDAGFFIFGDISLRVRGEFRLRFTLFESQYESNPPFISCLGQVDSDIFKVVSPKDFQGLKESTYISKSFADQGVRLRLRKEARASAHGTKRRHEEDEVPEPQPRPHT
ncbi:hypothetical protein CC86DRAFT_267387, partial [Ophiobolus disseminans]